VIIFTTVPLWEVILAESGPSPKLEQTGSEDRQPGSQRYFARVTSSAILSLPGIIVAVTSAARGSVAKEDGCLWSLCDKLYRV
jgi:hypothetical protein